MNNCMFTGRLTKEPELKYLQGSGTAVCEFDIAVDRRFKKEGKPSADFFKIVCFNKMAENVANYLSKGSQCAVRGSIQNDEYINQEGQKKYITKLYAEEIQFLDSKKSNGNQSSDYQPGFQVIADDYIPF